jgi:hypothetical protein
VEAEGAQEGKLGLPLAGGDRRAEREAEDGDERGGDETEQERRLCGRQ